MGWRALIASVAVVLVASGCSDSSEGSPTTAPSTVSTESSSATVAPSTPTPATLPAPAAPPTTLERVDADAADTDLSDGILVDTTDDTSDVAPGNDECADSSGACSLRAAVEEANATAGADVITVPAGIYVLRDRPLLIQSEITISGAGSATTIIDGPGSYDPAEDVADDCGDDDLDAFAVEAPAGLGTLTAMTIRDSADDGVKVRAGRTVVIEDSIIEANCDDGLDLDDTGATGTLTRTTVRNNGTEGVDAEDDTVLTVDASTISDNGLDDDDVDRKNEGIDAEDRVTVTIRNMSTISGNGEDGLDVGDGSTVTIADSTVTGNAERGVNSDDGSTVTITDSLITDNGTVDAQP